MTTRRRWILILLAAAGVLLVVALLAVRFAGPSRLRRTVERTASDVLGRKLRIAGPFRLSLGLDATLSASDVTLANASWGSDEPMIRVGRIEVTFELASLRSGPIQVRNLALEHVRVLLEADAEGRRNWKLDLKPRAEPSGPRKSAPLQFEHASVRDFELIYRPPRGAPVRLGIDDLDAALDPSTSMIDVKGAGRLGDTPWDIAGRVGSLARIVEWHDVDQTLTGHVGRSTLTLSGRIRDPMKLEGVHLQLGVEGPDVAAALGTFGLHTSLTGPFRVRGVTDDDNGGVHVDLDGAVGGVTAKVKGTVDALLTAQRIDATIDAAGPDASQVGAWTGVAGLPPRPFTVSGGLRRDGRRLSFTDLRIRAGETSVTVGGTLGDLPRCEGADLSVAGSGADLSELSALTRLKLPAGPFSLDGRFLVGADGLAIGPTTLKVRGATVHAAGTIGRPPGLPNLDLTAEGSGPDASILSGIVTVTLPEQPFEIRGRVARSGPILQLHDVSGRLGNDTFSVAGTLAPVRGLVGTDVHARVKGADLRSSASRIGWEGVPAAPFDAVGRLRVSGDRYELAEVDVSVGGLTARLDGDVGAPSPRDRTSLLFRARGKSLAELAAWGVPAKLPPDGFAASGRLDIEGGVYRVADVSAEVGPDHLALEGTLGALPDVAALDLTVTASGPSLADIGRFAAAAGIDPPLRIPTGAFTVTAQVRRAPSGIDVRDVKLAVDDSKLDVNGMITYANGAVGTDLAFNVESPDEEMLSGILGVELPKGPLRSHGKLGVTSGGIRFEDTEIAIGASFAELSGLLGSPPRLDGTDLDVTFEGSSLAAVLEPLAGLSALPSDSFELTAHVAGNRDALALDRLTARLGDSDLAGSLSMSLAGRPTIQAELSSKRLDVPRLVAGFTREPSTEAAVPAAAPKTRRKRDRLIPDWPLELGALRTFDAHLRLVAMEFPLPGVPIRNVVIAGDLRDGVMTINRSEGTGEYGGRTSSSFSLLPDGDGYRLHLEGRLDGGRFVVSKAESSPQLAPSLDIEFEIRGTGRSLHEIAASADGSILVMLGAGRVSNSLTDLMTSNVLIALLEAMNPYRKSSKYSAVECGVAAAGIDKGKLVAEPIAVRTDKMTVVGSGKLDLGSERIDLVWTIKPRRGVGLSGGSIANPYIKLGGTLANPALDLKPLEAVASTSAAVVTAGLTILFRGIYDRITAEKNVCVDALAKARKKIEARAPPPPD